jgi:hypothetical protein
LVESPKVGLIHNNWHFFWQKSQLLLPLPHFSKVFSFVNMLIYILLQNQHVSKVFTFLFVAFLTWNPTLVFHLFGWPTWPIFCRNPTLAKCGGEAQHLEKVRIWSPPGLFNVQSSTARPKTPRIGVFLVSLERSWSVDIENGLALAIWTFVAQVMGKRRAGSLTPDH